MDPLAPPIIGAAASNADMEQLRLLSILHYIMGAITLVGASVPIIHFTIGMLMLVNPGVFGNNPPPRFIGVLFVIISVLIMIFGWALGVCTILSGRYLARRVHRTFSMIVAAVNCIGFPFGTALGVFTIIVLAR